jgi:hypothetical protein
MVKPAVKLTPDTLYYSYFRNISGAQLFVPWAGSHGFSVKPGTTFRVPGDPRYNQFYPKIRSHAASIKSMIEEGKIEWLSSPAAIIDNLTNDGNSFAFLGGLEGPEVSITAEDARQYSESRILPTAAPTVEYFASAETFNVDWSNVENLDVNDQFLLIVTKDSGEPQRIACAFDRYIRDLPASGPGVYRFQYEVTAMDGRTGSSIVAEHEIEP